MGSFLFVLCDSLSAGQVHGKSVELTPDKSLVEVNVGTNATLIWRYTVKRNVNYGILWGIREQNSDNIRPDGVLFSQDKDEKAQLRSVPAAYAGRVFITDQASLVITDVRLSDEGRYICEISTTFLTVKKTIQLRIVGR